MKVNLRFDPITDAARAEWQAMAGPMEPPGLLVDFPDDVERDEIDRAVAAMNADNPKEGWQWRVIGR